MRRYAQTTQPDRARDAPQARFMPFAAGAVGIGLLLFAYYARTWRSFTGFTTAIDTCTEPFCDFVSFYYPMGEAIFRTGLPIRGFVYSPFIAILLAAFPPLGPTISLVLWGILQVLFVTFLLLLFRQLLPARLPVQLLFIALALSSFPLLHNLNWGQVGIITVVALLGMLVLYERGHRVAAAVLFAFAVSFKFYPLIFLALFIARRDTRFLLFAAAACGVFLFVIPGILLGVGDTLRFYGALFNAYRAFGWVVTNYNSQHFPHVALRLAMAMGHDAQTFLPLLSWIAYGVAAANIGLLFLVQRARLPFANLWSLQLLFLTIPFVLKTSWPVDLVFLSFAQAFLAWHLLEGHGAAQRSDIAEIHSDKGAWRKRTPPPRTVVALFLLLLSLFISNIVFFNLIDDRLKYGFCGFLFWADLLLLIASYVELLPPVLRWIRTPPTSATADNQVVM